MTYFIYRKDIGKAPKLAKAAYLAADEAFEATARVRRPSLEAFLSDGFNSLPMLPAQTIKNRPERISKHGKDGWVIPADSLGRQKEWTIWEGMTKEEEAALLAEQIRSTTQSMEAWIRKNMAHRVNPAQVSIVWQ